MLSLFSLYQSAKKNKLLEKYTFRGVFSLLLIFLRKQSQRLEKHVIVLGQLYTNVLSARAD